MITIQVFHYLKLIKLKIQLRMCCHGVSTSQLTRSSKARDGRNSIGLRPLRLISQRRTTQCSELGICIRKWWTIIICLVNMLRLVMEWIILKPKCINLEFFIIFSKVHWSNSAQPVATPTWSLQIQNWSIVGKTRKKNSKCQHISLRIEKIWSIKISIIK